jgi:hypothetical protein
MKIARTFFMIGALLAAGACHAATFRASWEITKGASQVRVFAPEEIPPIETDYHAYGLAQDPQTVIVSPSSRSYPHGPRYLWKPAGRSAGKYVYALDRKAGTVAPMAWEAFLNTAATEEKLQRYLPREYPPLAYGGRLDPTSEVVAITRQGKTFIAASSFDMEAREKTTYGIPSIIPFMGRQHFAEKNTFYSGAVILEVFDRDRPSTPLVQFKTRFRNLTRLPPFDTMACWAEGADQAFLVVVEPGSTYASGGWGGKIYLVGPLR